jgi:hypothetical protein
MADRSRIITNLGLIFRRMNRLTELDYPGPVIRRTTV